MWCLVLIQICTISRCYLTVYHMHICHFLHLDPNHQFVFTSCAAYNCWVEPRCTVESVKGSLVSLQQSSGNASCFHRLYYFGIGWGGKDVPDRPAKPPTSIENVFHNFTQPGQFYYDRQVSWRLQS